MSKDSQDSNASLELGKWIKETRTSSGYSLEEFAEKLKLPHQTIEAIESDNFDLLPGATYTRAYLKSIALELGLDKEELLKRYLFLTKQTPDRDQVQTISFDTSGSSLDDKKKPAYAKMFAGAFVVIALIIMAKFIVGSQDQEIEGLNYVDREEKVIDSLHQEPLDSMQEPQNIPINDSLFLDSLDNLVETDSSMAELVNPIDTATADTLSLKPKNVDRGSKISIKVKKDSTWFLIKSKNEPDDARWLREWQDPITVNRKDTISIEFGTIRFIELKINDKLVSPKTNIFKIFNGEIVRD